MKRSHFSLFAFAFFLLTIGLLFLTMLPLWVDKSADLRDFSTERAKEHIRNIAGEPHYVGSQNHDDVAKYLVLELQKLGLKPEIQEGTTLTEWGNLVKSKNIIARIPGSDSTKALLLISHYDSAPHSNSKGASDDASGVGTILEGLRAFLHQNKSAKNDILVLFSDAEELGLNGAALFVTQHRWAKDIGLAINFEARGTSGPAFMLMEVNNGNAALVKGFKEAKPQFPVSNSLMYSIYKMLPNDTDLTVFREKGEIPGFNFAFIDNHFNYHTPQDSYENLSPASVEHQGSYLMPLLQYFSNSDLSQLKSDEDFVYFTVPFYFVAYPFSWVLNMAIAAAIFFIFLLFIGLGKKIVHGRHVFNGFLNLLGSLLTTTCCTYFGWKILLSLYPDYSDILQGFTYNGHYYIAAFSFLALSIAFLFYSNSNTVTSNLNQSIAPLLIWILLNFGIASYLPGAGFFIIPVCFSLLVLAYYVLTQKTSAFLNLLFSVPAILIFVPFIVQFPIGLGLKMLVGSTAMLVLVFGLLTPVFASFTNKKIWAGLFFILALVFFGIAHFYADFNQKHKKPNSLLYFVDTEKKRAHWLTYNPKPDEWTSSYLGANPGKPEAAVFDDLFSKYDTRISYAAKAPLRNIPEPTIYFLRDSVIGNYRYLKIRIASNRPVNRYDILADQNLKLFNLKANGARPLDQKGSLYQRSSRRVLSYYVVDNEPLVLDFCVAKEANLKMDLLESSFNLLSNPFVKVLSRKSWMMPMPFVLNDAIVLHKKLKPSVPVKSVAKPAPLENTVPKDTVAQSVDSIEIR